MAERSVRTLTDAIAKIANDNTDWDKLLPLVAYYYRAAVHKATGLPPALLMLGRQLRLPTDVLYPPVKHQPKGTYAKYVEQLEVRLDLASQFARKHLEIDWDQRPTVAGRPRWWKPQDVNKPVYIFRPALAKAKISNFHDAGLDPV